MGDNNVGNNGFWQPISWGNPDSAKVKADKQQVAADKKTVQADSLQLRKDVQALRAQGTQAAVDQLKKDRVQWDKDRMKLEDDEVQTLVDEYFTGVAAQGGDPGQPVDPAPPHGRYPGGLMPMYGISIPPAGLQPVKPVGNPNPTPVPFRPEPMYGVSIPPGGIDPVLPSDPAEPGGGDLGQPGGLGDDPLDPAPIVDPGPLPIRPGGGRFPGGATPMYGISIPPRDLGITLDSASNANPNPNTQGQ